MASQCDLDTSIGPDNPRPLGTVLGEESIRDTVAPFVGYLETAVSVHEHSGARIGGLLTGNSFCDLLVRTGATDESDRPFAGGTGCLCDHDRNEVARAAVRNGSAAERACHAGMKLRAVPIIAERHIVGAVVGAVSEVPSDKQTVLQISEDAGIDFPALWQATGSSFHKPDYLYVAARTHLERLADTLGRFYEHSLERERSVSEILHREDALEETNRFLKSLLDGMAESVCTTDNQGNITYSNPAASRTVGYSTAELSQMNALDLVDPKEKAKVALMMQRRLDGKSDEYELEIICKDGSHKTILQTVSPLLRGDEVIGRIAVITDISERHRMEEDLKRQNRQLTLLQAFSSEGISRLTHNDLMDDLTREVAAKMGYEFCSIFLVSADGKRLEIVARNVQAGEDLDVLNKSGTHDLANPDFLRTPVAQAFITGKLAMIEDINKYQGYKRVREVSRILGSRSMVAMPLVFHGERLGAMVVHTRDLHTFARNELEFLQAIADQVSSIAGSARLYHVLEHSEERYRELYDSAADWMYSLSEDGSILDCNSTMLAALGFSKDEITGRHIYDFETKEDSQKAQVDIGESLKKGTFAAERHFIAKSGNQIIVDIHARLKTDVDGRTWWDTIGRDITERKENERSINLLAAAVENTRDCVVVSDLNGGILSINQAGAELYGYSREEMIGMHMGDLWSDKNSEGLREEIYHASLTEDGWEGQMWNQHRDGTALPVFASSARVNGEDGRPIALVGIVRDLSEEQRMTEEILRRNRELAVLNAVAATTAGSRETLSMLKSTLDVIIGSMGFDAGIVHLTDRAGEFLKVAASTFEMPDAMREMMAPLPVGQGLTGTVAATGEPIFVSDYMNSSYRMPQMPDSGPMASLGGVPLVSQEKVLGVLVVSTTEKHNFNDHEKALLTAVGNSIGVALDNARLFDDITRSKTQWESTFDAMTNGVSIHDRDYRIIRANQALARMLGTSVEEIIGKRCFEAFHGLDAPLDDCPLSETIRNGKHVSVTIHEPHLNRTLSMSADPYYDDQGHIIGCIHDVRDVTEQDRMRKQLAQSEKLRALGEMAGGVAHDFNNFLTVILGNTQLLLANHLFDTDTVDALQTVQRAATDAAETVRRIQEFTRVRTVRSFTPVDVNGAIANAIEVSRPRWRDEAESRGARIHMDVELNEVPPVMGNAAELGEVFMNLMLNAADALPEGGTITLRTGINEEGMVEIVVADDGNGMPEEVRQRVFEPFYSTKGLKGSGLGLSLAYGIVNRHGGDIVAQSDENQGSTFIVHLPVAADADANTELVGGSGSLDLAEPEETGAIRLGRVLVIEDEEMIRTLLAEILEQIGQEVTTADAGSTGVARFQEALASRPYDLVLTDLGMPEMSGWEVVERIKAISPTTPVALITGWGDQLDSEKMKTSGVDVVIAKPFSVGDVKKLVAEALPGK